MERGEERNRGPRTDHLFIVFLGGSVVLLIIFITILASVPPVSKDALVHHLAIPNLYLKHGGIYEIPFMPFSYYPMNLDLLYLIPLYFGNDIIPKFMHFSFALLTGWLLFGYLRRRLNATYALLGAILFLSIPVIVKLSITVYVDLGLVFFSTAALLLVLKWLERGFSPKYLVFSAVFSGLAMGTKYNGLVAFFILSLFVPFMYSRFAQDEKGRFFNSIGYGLLFVVVGLIVFSPWVIRNYAWTNNPVFPLYDHWFNPQKGEVQKSIGIFAYRALMYGESWWEIVLLPVRVFFEGKDGSPQYFDGKLNPFLFFLPFVGFWRIGDEPVSVRTEKKILLAYTVLFFAFALFGSGFRIRYIAPAIPPLVILSVFGVRRMVETIGKSGKGAFRSAGLVAVLFMVTFSVGLNLHYIIGQYGYVAPFDYLTGRLSRDQYIVRYRPEYPAMQYINRHLPPDALVLFIFLGNRGYYCERRYLFDMHNNRSALQRIVENAQDYEDIVLGLKKMGVTHLLMHSDIFVKWAKITFDEKGQALLKGFFEKHVKVGYSQSGYTLYILSQLASS